MSGFSYSVGQLPGVTNGSSANAGMVGEYLTSTVLVGSAVSLTTGATFNVTSITLTPGDWQCQGNVYSRPTGTIQQLEVGINISTGTLLTRPGSGGMTQTVVSSTSQLGQGTGSFQVLTSISQPVYLLVNCSFTATASAYGFLGCRRVR